MKTFANTSKGTLKLDWDSIERCLGFRLHENVKDFYSRVTYDEKFGIQGVMHFKGTDFVKPTGHERFDHWLLDEELDGNVEFCLNPLRTPNLENPCGAFEEAFRGDWTGGNDFGHRALIGELYMNFGQLYVLINNDTGKFEWADFGYGYYDVYEENPNGVVADDTQEFLEKFL